MRNNSPSRQEGYTPSTQSSLLQQGSEQSARLPILSGIKDAYNSSLRMDISEEALNKLRRFAT